MSVTVRLDGATADAFDEVVDRVDRTAVWVASEAIIHAARAMSATSRPLDAYLDRQHCTRRQLLAVDEHIETTIAGLAIAHAVGDTVPSPPAIARAALRRLIDIYGGPDGVVGHLGEARPRAPREVAQP